MGKHQRFEDLPAWQESAKLYDAVLEVVNSPQLPLTPACRDELERAALRVGSRIAEGLERPTRVELLEHLAEARAATARLRSMVAVLAAHPAARGHEGQLGRLGCLADSCGRQLNWWMRSVSEARRAVIDPGPAPAAEGVAAAPGRTGAGSARAGRPAVDRVRPGAAAVARGGIVAAPA